MIPWHVLVIVALVALSAPMLMAGDLEAVRAEPKLEKRAEKALKNAGLMVDAARDAYFEGEGEAAAAALAEVAEWAELCQGSLRATGKNPRKSYKHYKRAEIGMRQLLRRLQTLRDDMSYEDREQVEGVIERVKKVQNDLLQAVMGGGK